LTKKKHKNKIKILKRAKRKGREYFFSSPKQTSPKPQKAKPLLPCTQNPAGKAKQSRAVRDYFS
jgi:hypothetical protein